MANTRAIINLTSFGNNLTEIRRIAGPQVMICLAVKADAYGHGAVRIAEEALGHGVTWLAVATPDEAFELRNAGIQAPILLLCPAPPEDIELLILNDVSCFVADTGYCGYFSEAADRTGKTAKLHLEIDTGMGRTGCRPEEAAKIAGSIERDDRLCLEGICTHFAGAESDGTYTDRQFALFRSAVDSIGSSSCRPIIHAANSAGAIAFPATRLDMVRIGIAAYGYSPLPELLRTEPIMEFRGKVSFLKTVPPDTAISYGMTYKTSETTHIATISAGYADGYPRLLSNRGEVSIRGRRYRVCGTVCMDQFMVDLGLDTDVRIGDDVILFGSSQHAPDAEEVAGWIGTIPYEVLCNVGKRVPRIYE